MPTISIRFPGGRYHATPWGSHVNEGALEWPPSPWRLLRALIATGYAKLPTWQAGVMPEAAKELVHKLASVSPSYRIPPAIGAHSRHYMPTSDKPTLVLDACAVCATNAELLVTWDVALSEPETELLGELAEKIGYIGRAESWACVAVLRDPARADGPEWVRPCASCDHPGKGWEQIALMAPLPAHTYAQWRAEEVAKARERRPLPDGKKRRAKRQNEPYPDDLAACLQVETGWLQKEGWSQPPGSQRVLYWRKLNAIETAEPPCARPGKRDAVPFALLALATTARSRSALPLRARSLPQAELLHRALVSRTANTRSVCPELIGVDDHREPLRGHRHAHLLPLTLLKTDNHLDHILVWAPGGLGDAAQTVLRAIRKTYMKGGVGELSVRFAGSGTAEDMLTIIPLRRFILPSRHWQSYTPMTLPRFRKKRGKNSAEGQVIAELEERGFPTPTSIEWLKAESIAMRHFARVRRNRQPPPENYGYALRLTFAEPVAGPICIGYASHFGLGLFAATPKPTHE